MTDYRRLLNRVSIAVVLVITMSTIHCAVAGNSWRVELTDGSVISGELIGYANGVYTLDSKALGKIQLRDSDVVSLHSKSTSDISHRAASQRQSALATPQQLADIQNRIMSDPAVLSRVMSLQQDPAILNILSDPVIMQAITSGDIGALQSNPKILGLENNPNIREIMGLIGNQ